MEEHASKKTHHIISLSGIKERLSNLTFEDLIKITGIILIGLGGGLLLFEIIGINLSTGIYGAAAVALAGWLVLLPFLYELDVKQYVIIVILQILLFIGFYLVLINSSVLSAVILYGGLGGLIWIYKQKQYRRRESEYVACAGDVLFGASVVLLVALTFARVKGEEITVGILGTLVMWLFNGLAHLLSSWQSAQEFVKFVNHNLAFEYYLYAVMAVLLFAESDDGGGRYIEASWAGWLLGIVGFILLVVSLFNLLVAQVQNIGVHLFTHLILLFVSVLLIFLGRRIAEA